jgi:ribonuclease P protein component
MVFASGRRLRQVASYSKGDAPRVARSSRSRRARSSGACSRCHVPAWVAETGLVNGHGRERLGMVPVLHRRSEFLRVQQNGKRFRARCLLLLVIPGEAGTRLGLTISRRVGNAVTRNRVRRRLREIVRTRPQLLLDGWDHVLVVFPEAAHNDFTGLRGELTCLLERARAWASSRSSSSR